MSVLRRIFKGQSETSPPCPHCGEAMSPIEVADGLCTQCAWQFAQHAANGTGADTAGFYRDAAVTAAYVYPETSNGTNGRPVAPIAPYVPEAPSGAAPEHRCTRADLLQRDLDHTHALLAEVERQRDYFLAELETARHRLDTAAHERSEILQLVNLLLKNRVTAPAIVTPRIDLPMLERGPR